jgi:hypothetical protein
VQHRRQPSKHTHPPPQDRCSKPRTRRRNTPLHTQHLHPPKGANARKNSRPPRSRATWYWKLLKPNTPGNTRKKKSSQSPQSLPNRAALATRITPTPKSPNTSTAPATKTLCHPRIRSGHRRNIQRHLNHHTTHKHIRHHAIQHPPHRHNAPR